MIRYLANKATVHLLLALTHACNDSLLMIRLSKQMYDGAAG